MKEQLLHTPEGVRDIYNSECEKKMILQDRLHSLIQMYGYQAIQTPTFEFFDVFGKEIGTTPSKDLYKFFDREGNTLVLRPDITPSIARVAAKYYMDEEMPLRFSYMGNTFINNSSYQGRLKETTQLGAELIGDDSVDADAEMIALVADSFQKAGLNEFQISIGHVGFFNAICQAAKLDEDTKATVRDFICSKNYFGALEVIEELEVSDLILKIFDQLSHFMGSKEMLLDAKELVKEIPDAVKAIERLEQLYEVLSLYGYEKYISFDLSFLNRYDYYTGIIFDGYTFGSGEAVAKGGRYDELLKYFGKESPSVGCVILIDQLMLALSRQKIAIPISSNHVMVLYTEATRKEAVAKAMNLRSYGTRAELILKQKGKTKKEYEAYAKQNNMNEIITME